LTTLVVGGVLSLAVALWNGVLQQAMSNIYTHLNLAVLKKLSGGSSQIEIMPASAGNLPYAVAIAAGTLIHLVLVRSGHALLM
jgi:prepilin peptidase CpaA